MKVLQINSVIDYGSTGRISRNLYDYLEKNGHECVIAFGRGESTPGYSTIKIGSKIDQTIHGIYSRLTDRHGFGSTKSTENLILKIKNYNPDIIHLHNLHGYYLNIEILFNYLSKANIPVVWLLHDQWPISGHSANFNLDYNGSIPNTLPDMNELKKYPKTYCISQFEKNLKDKYRLFTSVENMTIISPSKWLSKMMEKSFLNKYPIKTINNGVDTETFRVDNFNVNKLRRVWKAENKVIILGMASIWTKSKGIDDFVKLYEEIPYDDYQIVLVGIDEKNRLKLPEEIISIERTNSIEELRTIYNASDLFLNPTYFDNFPTVNIEALASGTPVITYDTGGSPESIDKKTGSVVSKNDISQLIVEIKKWGNKSTETIDNCRRRATDLYSKEIAYERYLSLYEDLLK